MTKGSEGHTHSPNHVEEGEYVDGRYSLWRATQIRLVGPEQGS